jgi:outer membrane protein assembly factor BamB
MPLLPADALRRVVALDGNSSWTRRSGTLAGKKTFLCYAPQDRGHCIPLTAALDAWEVSHTALAPEEQPVAGLTSGTEQHIRDCEIFLRLCTGATRDSLPVHQATELFRDLLARERRSGRGGRRRLVNVVMDPAYELDAIDQKTLYVDTANKARSLWLEELATPLGVATRVQRLSRRALVSAGIASALALASSGALASVLIQRARSAPPAILPNTKQVSGQVRWATTLGATTSAIGAANDFTRLTLDGQTLYALSGGEVFTVTTADGGARRIALPADFEPDPEDVNDAFTVAEGFLLLLGASRAENSTAFASDHLWGLRAHDGALLWKATYDRVGRTFLANGIIYCATFSAQSGGALVALRAPDGAALWRQPIATDPELIRTSSNDASVLSAIALADGRLYVGAADHTVSCYDAATGAQRWSVRLAGSVVAAPSVAYGRIYVGATDGACYAFDAATGALRWRSFLGPSLHAEPAVGDEVVYIGAPTGHLFALDAHSGALYWRAYAGPNEQVDTFYQYPIVTKPAMYLNVICVAAGVNIAAFDLRDGALRWTYHTIGDTLANVASPPASPPLMVERLFLVGTPERRVFAMNP